MTASSFKHQDPTPENKILILDVAGLTLHRETQILDLVLISAHWCVSVTLCGQMGEGGGAVEDRCGTLREVGGEEAEWLALVGWQRGAVALKVAWDAAASGPRAVTEGLDAALSLELYKNTHTEASVNQKKKQKPENDKSH